MASMTSRKLSAPLQPSVKLEETTTRCREPECSMELQELLEITHKTKLNENVGQHKRFKPVFSYKAQLSVCATLSNEIFSAHSWERTQTKPCKMAFFKSPKTAALADYLFSKYPSFLRNASFNLTQSAVSVTTIKCIIDIISPIQR